MDRSLLSPKRTIHEITLSRTKKSLKGIEGLRELYPLLRSWNQGSTPASSRKQWPVPRVSEQEYLDNMNEIVSLARLQGAGVIVIAAPYRDSVTNPPEAELMVRYRKALGAEIKQRQRAFLEIPELTEAAYPSNQGWFDELIHPNHMGHRLLAAELLELLSKERLAPGLTVPTLTP